MKFSSNFEIDNKLELVDSDLDILDKFCFEKVFLFPDPEMK